MNIQNELHDIQLFRNLGLLASQVVEGFISGMHKSPFHGFSSEFAEHRIYNPGESTRHIDWKLYARTDKLYSKSYEEETNLRCHIIIDNSSSMYYPEVKQLSAQRLNKIGFSVLASAALMNLLKRQRDAVGLSVYSDTYNFYAPEKGSNRHYQMLLRTLEEMVVHTEKQRTTKTYTFLHQIAEKMHRRSMIFLFTDMFQTETGDEELFDALRHLKYNKHEVVLFHVTDKAAEVDFDFDNAPKRFVDVETGEMINLYADNIREAYKKRVESYTAMIKLKAAQYRIKYVEADIRKDLQKILQTYLIERQKFI
ncbi:DUF58 domain-containing protein [Sinomicrobium soli]|uniref:DUF58 domain-containing protein n=1 Tax=Sinomicrobium sp. N-1-3-6 TaxID=2219864 RepID=UPI000DCBAC31|nr:DUF58 domain-containing protein [Sinomicrobium sp. N-1-3-6]RAV31035.1 DUF58 domain-containing protein [Sinomicrobium sp. N-1-3-6]